MGYNTTVVVMNDALQNIADDPEFGAKLARAIREVGRNSQVDVDARSAKHGHYVNAATVIETHHADYDVFVAVGGNRGKVIKESSWFRA